MHRLGLFPAPLLPALLGSLLSAGVAMAQAAPPHEGAASTAMFAEPPTDALTLPQTSAFPLPREEPSFSDRAKDYATLAFTVPGDPAEDDASLVWFAVSGAIATAAAARQLRRPTPRPKTPWLPRTTQPAGQEKALDAQSWRLSHFEDLPPSDLAPLYPSLDDPEDFDQCKVIALRPERRAPQHTHTPYIPDPDVIEVKPRVVHPRL